MDYFYFQIDETMAEENVNMHPGNKRTTLMRTASTSVPLESLAMSNIEMFRDKKKTGKFQIKNQVKYNKTNPK